jgi:ABC-type nitrate/sulfonate/bicarbonate transport system permease component
VTERTSYKLFCGLRIYPAVAGLLGCAVFLIVLEIAVRSDLIPPTVIPRPSDFIAGMFTLHRKVDFEGAIAITFGMTALALFFELLVALPIGYFLAKNKVFRSAYEGWLAALFAAPVFLLYPLFMVIFGRNFITLVVMGFIPGVIPMTLQTMQGFLSVSRTLVKVGHSYGLTEGQIFRKIMIPAAVPGIFTGFRLAVMYTLINIIGIEYLVDIGGLGRIVSDRYSRFDITGTYAAIIAVIAVSMLFQWLIAKIERSIRPV